MKQPMTWYTLWKKLGKQPLYKTQNNRVKIKIDGKLYECGIVYENNGSDFHLEPMENIKVKE